MCSTPDSVDPDQRDSSRPSGASVRSPGVWLSGVCPVLMVIWLSACSGLGLATRSTPEVQEGPDPDQLVPLDAFHETAAQLAMNYPTPPGGSARVELMPAELMDRPTLEFRIAFGVACQWHRYWLDMVSTGQSEQATEAMETVLGIPDWPVLGEMDQAADFWSIFYQDFPAVDGSRLFINSNCPGIRRYLPAPNVPPISDRTVAVLTEERSERANWIDSTDRPHVIARMLDEIPPVPEESLNHLIGWLKPQTELEIASVVARHAWCHLLGAYIDAADAGDWETADLTAVQLGDLVEHPFLAAVDPDSHEHEARLHVLDGLAAGAALWPVSDYEGNCFAIDHERDLRMHLIREEVTIG